MITDLPLTVRYALAACLFLAQKHDKGRASGRGIAEATGIPPAFLAKVLQQLGRSGVIEGERGHRGGYRLARPPAEVFIADVVGAVTDRDGQPTACALGDRDCSADVPCALHDLWAAATAPLSRLAETVTLDRLCHMDEGTILAER